MGETAFLKITNNHSEVLNIAVLDLSPNWSIQQVFPGGQGLYFEPLDPGRSLDLIPLTADLPPGYGKGTDVIKVFASTCIPISRYWSCRHSILRNRDDAITEPRAASMPRQTHSTRYWRPWPPSSLRSAL